MDLLSVLTGRLCLVGPIAGALHFIKEESLRTGKVEPLTFRAPVEHAAVVWIAEETLTRTAKVGRRWHLFGFPVERFLTRWQWLFWQRFCWLRWLGRLGFRLGLRLWFRFVVVGS